MSKLILKINTKNVQVEKEEEEDNDTNTKRFRNFVFTFNTPELAPKEFIDSLDKKNVIYIIFGKEFAPTTGRLHYQGYICFKNGKTLKSVWRNYFKSLAHVEVAKGTAHDNYAYCSKDKEFLEWGEIPTGQGSRTDIKLIIRLTQDNTPMKNMIQEGVISSYQHLKFAENIRKYLEPERNWVPEVFWFFGPSGTNKTRTAIEMCKNPWISSGTLKWWDGYDGHSDVILDDFRKDFCTFHHLLGILDRYPFRVEVKGGYRSLLAKRIFITCPDDPFSLYENHPEHLDQLKRRITTIKKFYKEGEKPTDTQQISVANLNFSPKN